MQMRDRYNHDGIAVQAENNTVRKKCEQASPKPGFYFH